MSAAETNAWLTQQKAQVSAYKPQRPEMPNTYMCAQGDTACKSRTPPPPPGSINEPFVPYGFVHAWPAVLFVASVAFVALTMFSSFASGETRGRHRQPGRFP